MTRATTGAVTGDRAATQHASVDVVVLAKAPAPGRVKTRLSPPYTLEQAADLAAAALKDTLAAVGTAAGDGHRFLVLDGDAAHVARWQRPGFTLLPQRGAGLDERLAHALVDIAAEHRRPVLLVGMDTPQLRPVMIKRAIASLLRADAVLGPATDGGFWAIGLHAPVPEDVLGIPMSTADTGRRQLERLQARSRRTIVLATLTDVDDAPTARAVAAAAPQTGFARLLATIGDMAA